MEHAEEVDILLVDDNVYDAELTIRAFNKSKPGLKILHLKDGAEALAFLFDTARFQERNTGNPKLILLDLKMPKVDGIEVLQKIKASDRTKQIPIIILTSSNQDTDIERCYRLGANSYIVKPVNFDDFLKVVSELGTYWLVFNHPPAM